MIKEKRLLTAPSPKPGFVARPTGKCIFERQNHAATLEVISRPRASCGTSDCAKTNRQLLINYYLKSS